MSHFEPIELEWRGVTYALKGDGKIMRALAAVEDHITLAELAAGQERGTIPLAKLSRAYAELLRQAGCRVVSDADVYAGMWSGGVNHEAIQEAINSLLMMMMPPDAIPDDDGESEAEGAEGDEEGKASDESPKTQKSGGSSKKRGKRG